MKKAILIVMLALLLDFTPQAMAQEQGEYCDWFWDYTFYPAGGWEYWCWSPSWGWWYGESEDGKKKKIAPTSTTAGPLQFFSA